MKVDAMALEDAVRAYCDSLGHSYDICGPFLREARDKAVSIAITTYLASLPGAGAGEPVGWKLVPLEPTPAMLQAVVDANRSEQPRALVVGFEAYAGRMAYRSMIAAAPASPAPASMPSEEEIETALGDHFRSVVVGSSGKAFDETGVAFPAAAFKGYARAVLALLSPEEK